MAKTLLQLTNELGKNLRRSTGSTYTSITQNADVIFAVQMINRAKNLVQSRWKWDQLQKTITFSSVGGTTTYDTSSLAIVTSDPDVTTTKSTVLQDRKGRLQFWDVTSTAFRLSRMSRDQAQELNLTQTAQIAKPGRVAWYPNGTGLTVHFGDTPAGVRNYSFRAYVPQDDLTAAATELQAPEEPVVLAATAFAADERGEELGLDSSEWWDAYEESLGSWMDIDVEPGDLTLIDDRLDYFAGQHRAHRGI